MPTTIIAMGLPMVVDSGRVLPSSKNRHSSCGSSSPSLLLVLEMLPRNNQSILVVVGSLDDHREDTD
jgi:hypothetical protein